MDIQNNDIYYELESAYNLKARDQKDLIKTAVDNFGNNQIYAKTEYTLVSKGTELAAWKGLKPLRPGRAYPRVIGYCNLAKVLKVGSEIKGIEPDQYIITHQSHRSSFLCKENEVLFTFGKKVEAYKKKLLTTYLYHIGYQAILSGDYMPGQSVAIIGLGTLGYTTTELVKCFGGFPTIFTGNIEHSSLIGLEKYSVLKSSSIDLYKDKFDLVINTSDKWDDHILSLKIVKEYGAIVSIGFPGRDQDNYKINPLSSEYMYCKSISYRQCGNPKGFSDKSEDSLTGFRAMKYLSNLILNNKINPQPLLEYEAEYSNLIDVYKFLENTKPGILTAVIKWLK